MGSFSIWHWLILILFFGGMMWPLAKIFSRSGRSGWFALLALVPVIGIPLALWWIALADWEPRKSEWEA